MRWQFLLYCFSFSTIWCSVKGQDSLQVISRPITLPDNFIADINSKTKKVDDKIVSYSEKSLRKLEKQEEKLRRKLAKVDSLAAVQLFGDVKEKYASLRNQLKGGEAKLNGIKEYLPGLDTLKTSLNFLNTNGLDFLKDNKQIGQLSSAVKDIDKLESKLRGTEAIRSYIKERKEFLKKHLEKFGMVKDLAKYNKQAYYYTQQINEYKAILQDPRKREQKALELITKIPAFQKFFSEHSELAALFPAPANYGTPQAIQGLQTRASVQAMIQQQMQAGGPNAQTMMQQGVQQAQSEINKLKDKINQLGGMGSKTEIPDFKPNNQKTKTFWSRLEYGTNMQNTRSNLFLPTTSDLGLSIGYRLGDKSTIGIGASYKLGWGKDIRHVTITHEGVGLRSYLDWKLKGSIYVSGGYEQNYRQRFDNLNQLKQIDYWQQSGLLGVSKKYTIGKKWKGDFKLLYDFMYRSHTPETQPVLFRFGYGF